MLKTKRRQWRKMKCKWKVLSWELWVTGGQIKVRQGQLSSVDVHDIWACVLLWLPRKIRSVQRVSCDNTVLLEEWSFLGFPKFRHVPSKSKVFSFDQHIQNFRERVQAYYTLMDKSHKWCYHKLVKCAANYQEKPLCFTTLLTNLVIIALKLVG